MHHWVEIGVRTGAIAAQFVFGFIAVAAMLRLLPQKKPRWLHLTGIKWRSRKIPDGWLSKLKLSREQQSYVDREMLLAGCGVEVDPGWYVAARKLLLIVWLISISICLTVSAGQGQDSIMAYLTALLVFCWILLLWDLPWLRLLRKLRSERMTKEIYVMSNQLLYLADSSLHIHTKMTRCIPYTRTLRSDLERLLAEWYHDAEQALRQFKLRMGTDDGMSFVETIDSLRIDDSEEYYMLLRDRIQEYKEKLELAKDSRKETASYLLFMLAGVPILYTFQVFIYPWVMEGQKLFASLG
ncbi:hypothetical protein BBD42_15080 [Paenibacillus sp. BIHB 4019]|uniref:Type II secretion system protein GspF domain-containing protein n=1 Tax=Paenibacillus sp. BIHB 4019 TaxID=1870819 RepID=A0A1B2DIY2_9BACL|nr:hypothetical protein [Paenibacillus sp. BIHB 4019]ANY67656.1 hypothetical protein BBD42_15080 [Paenibacillus sp. BIHB 4019]